MRKSINKNSLNGQPPVTRAQMNSTKLLSWKPQAITSYNLLSELVAYMGNENRMEAYALSDKAKARMGNGVV